ncbi:MAG: histidine kinase N-terminal 7TM domain-containing protein, partial [Candidatus Margulisiibacteriota bacterium]
MHIALLATTVLFIASIIHFGIGSAIYIKDDKDRVNRAFFALSLSLVLWTLFYGITYLTKTDEATLFWTRILTIPTFFYPSLFLYLAMVFPRNDYKPSMIFYFYHALFILLFLFFMFSRVYIYSARLVMQGIEFQFGFIYNVLGIYIVSTMLYGCYLLIRKLFVLDKQSRQQVAYVFVGALLSVMMGAIFGVTLPMF